MQFPPPIAFIDFSEAEQESIDLIGTAYSDYFDEYSLEYGVIDGLPLGGYGDYLNMKEEELRNLVWTPFYESGTPVQNGILFENFETASFLEGMFLIFKLTVKDTFGNESHEYFVHKIDNIYVEFDGVIIKDGNLFDVNGSVGGSAFSSYVVEWAAGWVEQDEDDSVLEYSSEGVLIQNPRTMH